MAGTTDRAVPEHPGDRAIRDVLHAVGQILEVAHLEHVGHLSITGSSLAIHPSRLADGETIARALGLTPSLDYAQALPPITDWTGDVAGLEVHVRAAMSTSTGQGR